ncbi:hypothetical protein L1049_007919 [Liquidambar formosana]|uniref:Cation/H(+) antiporter C-terminal domain-containing protein n=1 Tax=Liquidambar formosana TaxID=63359 RepID=A0AAP0S8W3_LIQFO
MRKEGDESRENGGDVWRRVNQMVLMSAPCSVAVFVDRGFDGGSRQRLEPNSTDTKRVCVVFFGGPDDREALELGGRMAEHPSVSVTVIRFVEITGMVNHGDVRTEKSHSLPTRAPLHCEREKELNEAAVTEFQRRSEGSVEYIEKVVDSSIAEGLLAIGRSGEYELVVVGKGGFPSTIVPELADQQAEYSELGPIGDMLASSGHDVVSSVLVIQQHHVAHTDGIPGSKKMVQDKDAAEVMADESSV